ncbi:unnamed protein product [Brassica rapa subsp. narinosa]
MLKSLCKRSVHAYVVFETEQAAEASLAHNMSLVIYNSFHIRVDRACPPCKKLKGQDDHLYDSKRTVFMGNLPFDDEEVYQLFTGKSNLENNESANLVLKKGYLKLRDGELRISRVKADATPSKRKNNPSEARSPAQKRQQKEHSF